MHDIWPGQENRIVLWRRQCIERHTAAGSDDGSNDDGGGGDGESDDVHLKRNLEIIIH